MLSRAQLSLHLPRAIAAAVVAAFLAYYGLACFRGQWGGDFQGYVVGVARLYASLIHPVTDAIDAVGVSSSVNSPYLVAVAALGRLAGVSPYRALQLAGLFNLIAYLLAIRYFVSRYSVCRSPDLAAACFLLVTLFVRWRHFGWSSETSVLTLQSIQAYPSMLAWALAFTILGLVEDHRRSPRVAPLAALAAGIWLLTLTHLITATWVIGLLGLRALYLGAVDRNWKIPVSLLAAAAGGASLTLLWPYFSVLDEIALTAVRESSRFGQQPLREFGNLYLVAGVGALWLVGRLRRHLFFVLAFAASYGALLFWNEIGVSFGRRYVFFMAFSAQFLVAEVATAGVLALLGTLDSKVQGLSPARPHPSLDWPVVILLLVATCVCWWPSPMWQIDRKQGYGRLASPGELLRRPSPHDAHHAQFGLLPAHVGRDDVVISAVRATAFDLEAVTGARVVSARSQHRVPAADARDREMARLFAPDTPAQERYAIIRRHCANRLLVRTGDAMATALAPLFAQPVYRDDGYTMFDVSPVGRDVCADGRHAGNPQRP